MNKITTIGQESEILAGTGLQDEIRLTFDGGANSGGIGTQTLFTVTGVVAVKPVAFVEVDLAGAATIELGTTINTAGLLAQVADATSLDAAEIWHDATPDSSAELSSVVSEKIITQDIKLKIGSAAVTAGRIRFVIFWRPITKGASVVSVLGLATSASPSLSPSASASASLSPSSSASRSLSPSSSVSPSSSASPSSSVSSSASPSLSPSSSASRSQSPSSSVSASLSPSASASRSLSPSSSASASLSPSSSVSASLSPSSSVSPSLSPSPL